MKTVKNLCLVIAVVCTLISAVLVGYALGIGTYLKLLVAPKTFEQNVRLLDKLAQVQLPYLEPALALMFTALLAVFVHSKLDKSHKISQG